MMFSMHALWLKKAFTTGVPVGTRGALQRKASRAKTLWKDWNSSSPCGRTVIRWQSSVRITRSRIIGLANRESCDGTKKNNHNFRSLSPHSNKVIGSIPRPRAFQCGICMLSLCLSFQVLFYLLFSSSFFFHFV